MPGGFLSGTVSRPLIHRKHGLLSACQNGQHERDSDNKRTYWTHGIPHLKEARSGKF
ncbi:hypothetical protein STXM2123_3730 [Streptomyces sp. F-3]|nr:hypothetical protein STXM2123_3730 [Streptomyces sp. F-3]